MKGMGRIQHLFTICSFWANANPSGKPHGSCEQCVRTLKVAVIYVVEEADSLFRRGGRDIGEIRSEEHTSELQSLMRISYAVFCLKKKKTQKHKRYRDKMYTTYNN